MKYKVRRRHLLLFITITFGLILVIYGREVSLIADVLAKANPTYLWAAFGCVVLYWLIEARTLQLMLRTFEPGIGYLEVVKLVMATQFFNGITPFSTGGQPFQIYILSKRKDLEVTSVTSASIHNFVMYQVVLVLMGLGALGVSRLMGIAPSGSNVGWMVAMGFALNAGVVLLLLMIGFLPTVTAACLIPIYSLVKWIKGEERSQEIQKSFDEKTALFHKEIWQLVANPDLFFSALLLNAIKLLSLYSVTYFLCRTVGNDTLSFVQGIVLSAYVMLITSMVPVPGASGGAEVGFAVLFGTLIGAHVTVIMLLWRFVTYYIGLVLGSIVYYVGYATD